MALIGQHQVGKTTLVLGEQRAALYLDLEIGMIATGSAIRRCSLRPQKTGW